MNAEFGKENCETKSLFARYLLFTFSWNEKDTTDLVILCLHVKEKIFGISGLGTTTPLLAPL
jgi:hypothetical protein